MGSPHGGEDSTATEDVVGKVHIRLVGGTIVMDSSSGQGVEICDAAAALETQLPADVRPAVASVSVFREVPSAYLDLQDVIALGEDIATVLSAGGQGVVVVQGTDTLEEVAFALALLDIPPGAVVLTGAMRNPTMPSADGAANLRAGVAVAADDLSAVVGPVVVLNDEIHSAWFVQKTDSSAVSAFCSPETGPLGRVVEGSTRWRTLPATMSRRQLQPRGAVPDVPILKLALGETCTLIDAAVGLGVDGLVVEAYGAGHVSSGVAECLERAAAQVPVVLCSRTGGSGVLTGTYGFVGAEADLLARGLIPSLYLDSLKARILLVLHLMAQSPRHDIVADFRNPMRPQSHNP